MTTQEAIINVRNLLDVATQRGLFQKSSDVVAMSESIDILDELYKVKATVQDVKNALSNASITTTGDPHIIKLAKEAKDANS